MKIQTCTFTGVDEDTNLETIAAISTVCPQAEWGFLYSPTLQGTNMRYPSVNFIRKAINTLPITVKIALHICGKGVIELMNNGLIASELTSGISNRGGRIQLNFNAEQSTIMAARLQEIFREYTYISRPSENPLFIIQHNAANDALATYLIEANAEFGILFDSSGGQGKSPSSWPEAIQNKYCGYAGGLSPDMINTQLNKIKAVNTDRETKIWIDMESHIRSAFNYGNSFFDINKCANVLNSIRDHL